MPFETDLRKRASPVARPLNGVVLGFQAKLMVRGFKPSVNFPELLPSLWHRFNVSLEAMNICAEFEREKDGRWVATIPGVPGTRDYGSTRLEAAIGVTVRSPVYPEGRTGRDFYSGCKRLVEDDARRVW